MVTTCKAYNLSLDLNKYKDTSSRSLSFTTGDCRKLQVLQNSVSRLITGARYDTSTSDLLNATGSLSVQQMVAYHTLVMVHKIVNTGLPCYLADRLQLRSAEGRELRGQGAGMILQSDPTLSVSRGGFVYRGSRLFNMLSWNLRTEISVKKFKPGARSLVKENIKIRPGT